jgi:uncharacterized protein YlzI (FlbEa/FlbD family)
MILMDHTIEFRSVLGKRILIRPINIQSIEEINETTTAISDNGKNVTLNHSYDEVIELLKKYSDRKG